MAYEPVLDPSTTRGAAVRQTETGTWRLTIPSGGEASYRLAQLDDTSDRSRREFLWTPPLVISITARVSSPNIPGTWGFGLWNDPFSLSIGLGGGTRRFPVLPNAAWLFYGSPPNFLSFRDDMPAQGFIAQVFRSVTLPPLLLAFAGLGIPALAWPWLAQKLRPTLRSLIHDESSELNLDVDQWHTYTLVWREDGVNFAVDGTLVFESRFSPRGRLGFVLWIDNQYAAYPPDGVVSFGKLSYPEQAWIEMHSLSVESIRPG